MSLNGVMVVILRYFIESEYLPGVLRKSSRSLSHLLMSSCLDMCYICVAYRFYVCHYTYVLFCLFYLFGEYTFS